MESKKYKKFFFVWLYLEEPLNIDKAWEIYKRSGLSNKTPIDKE
jgi:hypothetical protein